MEDLTQKGVFFVTRLKSNAVYDESHDHHFKWWFDVAPVRGKILAPPKRRVSKADYGRPHNEATILLPYFPYMTPVPDPGCIS